MLTAKALEVRDKATFIPVLAVDMNPGAPIPDGTMSEAELEAHLNADVGRRYLLRRCGYACDGEPNVILTRLSGNGNATNDPYEWGDRTFQAAHHYIIKHWAELQNWIEEFYPGVFAPEWLYGGKKRGWSLRYKKTRALCTFLPEYRRFSAVVGLGGAEREKFEERRYV